MRVEQAGSALWQGQVKLADVDATDSTPWLAELSVPLPPGKYQVTALVKDAQGAGGMKAWDVDVPAFGGKLALSTPVVARASGDGLPKADGSGEALLPFQIGNFIVRPMIGAQFKRGESAAFVVQVYGDAPAATIEYGLYRDGVWQSTLEPTQVQRWVRLLARGW